MPPLTIILILVATGVAVTIALIFLADARDWRRMRERMRHQRALAEMEAHGDYPALPEGLRAAPWKTRGRETALRSSPRGFARHSHHDDQGTSA